MITPTQLYRHGFIATPTTDITGFFMRGSINGVLSGGVFHFPIVGEWAQCKNIGHLKYLYKKHVGEKLEYNPNYDTLQKIK